MACTTVPTPRVSQQAGCHDKSRSRRAGAKTAVPPLRIGGDLEYFLVYILIREPYMEIVATRGAARVWGVSGALPPFK